MIVGKVNTDRYPCDGGGTADVYIGRLRRDGTTLKVAVKALRFYKGGDAVTTDTAIYPEALFWYSLRHSRIVPLLGVSRTTFNPPRTCLVSPWLDNGNITQYMRRETTVDPIILLCQAADGLLYIHSRHFVHSDVKPENILINDDGHACLSDDLGFTSVSASRALSGLVCRRGGTTRTMAPELFEYTTTLSDNTVARFPVSIASDVYAFGMTIYEVISRTTAFHGTHDHAIIKQVLDGKRPQRPNPPASHLISDDIWELIRRCWAQDLNVRCKMSDVLGTLTDIQSREAISIYS